MEHERYAARDFVATDLPRGFQTAWGWLAANEPASFEFMSNPGMDAMEFQDRAAIIAREESIEGIELPAPLPIRQTGGPATVLAFPNIVFRCVFAA